MKKIIGIFIVVLLIWTAVLPGTVSDSDKLYILNHQDQSLGDQIFNQAINLLS